MCHSDGPGEMKRREVALDPVVSPEEIISREVELGKLQAPVYDILPSTNAVFSYATGSRKLSANEQFFMLVLKQ